MARVVVSGYMMRFPVPGNILAYYQYVHGFSDLGHDVTYVEESGWPYGCYNPETRSWSDHPDYGLAAIAKLAAANGLDCPMCFVNSGTGRVDGATWPELKRILAEADVLVNIGGVCWLPEFKLCARRALVDMDPVFTQLGGFGAKILSDYDTHFSYGTNIGKEICPVPDGGVPWVETLPPVVMKLWPACETMASAPFTTIANWSAYGSIEWNGEQYGQKDREFLRFIDLPRFTPQPLELALSGADESIRSKLAAAGWKLREGGDGVGTELTQYRGYIARSRGEFSVAKNAYVKTRSGWFSDRTACYLASGLPAVVQDTGISDYLPVGNGLFVFSSMDEAAQALATINRDYENHRSAAKEIATAFFNHEVVLPRLLEIALNGHKRPIVT